MLMKIQIRSATPLSNNDHIITTTNDHTTTNNDENNTYENENSVHVLPIEEPPPQSLDNLVSRTSSSSKVRVPKRKLPLVEHPYARQQAPKRKVTNDNNTYNNNNSDNAQVSQKERPSSDTSVIEEFVVDDNVVMFIHEDDDVPETYQDIFKSPNSKEWLEAVEYELNALKRNQTWTLEISFKITLTYYQYRFL